ncbi:iron-sulfur cluster insertion protein ErpA [Candidatus Thioglobus autotrophicus]|uniref:iron-sulfur cluster insertion protein ErpA n=1 Tax=Candidatus Thioglobus autotrophicus TaxID=1705394 RepID=UPI00299D907E|nr:iron-sulfur cluster insertion protein ErpA [Candidatus Thioglobus autotrophicus]WPE17991.1 iron-sulfur cluster insertion protein ErpA [Candidatus Thioglobus autotrophicus]
MSEVLEEADIIFSDNAANKVATLITEEKNDNLRLRVYITGGGCSGFSYGFTFDEEYKEGDSGVENNGVQLVIDPMSYQYLIGATVDYLEDLQGSRFIIHNPNAKTTCGCGSSFSV